MISTRIVARARGGRRRTDRHHLDAGEAARRAARHRRAISQRLLLGRHPSASRRRGGRHSRRRTDRADRSTRRSWRSARRGSIISTSTVRARRRSAASAPISLRRGRPACRWSSTPAMPTRTAAASSKTRWRRGRSRAVLHCYTGGRDLAMKAIASGAVDLLHRHPDLQEVGSVARAGRRTAGRPHHGRDRRAVSGARQIPRQAQRAVLRGRSRQGAGGDARRHAARRYRGRRRKTSSACSPKCRRRRLRHDPDADDPRLRLIGRRAAPGARLGRLRSQQSQEPPPPLLAAGRAIGATAPRGS